MTDTLSTFAERLQHALRRQEITPEVWQAARLLHALIPSLQWHEQKGMILERAMVREWDIASGNLERLVDTHGEAALEAFRYYATIEDMLKDVRSGIGPLP